MAKEPAELVWTRAREAAEGVVWNLLAARRLGLATPGATDALARALKAAERLTGLLSRPAPAMEIHPP